jgi:hypothetical protein
MSSRAEIVHTAVCLGLQRSIFEMQIAQLKRTNHALLLLTLTAYILGMYCGFIAALNRIDGP